MFSVQGLKSAGRQEAVLGGVDGIVEFMRRTQTNEQISSELLKSAVALLGDLAQTFGKRMAQIFRQPFVASLLNQGAQDEETQDTSQWASQVCI